MPAVAITDHGNMFGAIEFYKTCTAAGVQPILGCEVYLAPRSRKEQKVVGRQDDFEAGGNFHMILLAMNLEGYRNLCKLVTLSYTEGFYFKPRIDKELLAELNGGLIATSGCLSGEINRAFQAGSYERGREDRDRVSEALRRSLLPRDPGQPSPAAGHLQRDAEAARPRPRDSAAGHQRLPLPHPRGRQGARGPALHSDGGKRSRIRRAGSSRPTSST